MKLSGTGIQRLMRKHRVTIRGLAAKMRITQKRVRQVRKEGVQGIVMTTDWLEAITGEPWFSRLTSGVSHPGKPIVHADQFNLESHL